MNLIQFLLSAREIRPSALRKVPSLKQRLPIILVARSEAKNILGRWNVGILGLNPTQGMNVCAYSVFVLSCVGSDPASG
jgi:hypothetical protein